MRNLELLIPAGNLENLKVAIDYGADAVYIGGEFFSLRAKAKNFTKEDMKSGIKYAHERGKKVYVTANILGHNDDLDAARGYFEELKEIGPDALIISDPGIFTVAKEVWPEVEIHISTQANNTNYATYLFWWKLGATRVVTARELSLEEIKKIRDNIPEEMEIETFVHGAMCMAISGRCLLSNYMTGRDANRGDCAQACRWKYSLVEETRPGETMPVYEDEHGTYIFNSKDLCTIEMIDKIVQAENKAEDIDRFITLMQSWLAIEWYGMREEAKKGIMGKEDKKTLLDTEYSKYTKWMEEKDNGQE